MKAGPDIEVRASQKVWMEERVKAGGLPLFFIQWGDAFYFVPGSRAAALRDDPTEEGVKRLASSRLTAPLSEWEFFTIIRNPENEYRKNIG